MSQPRSPISPLNRSLERLGRAVAERKSAEVIELPLWPDPKRGTPNSFLRSALFSAIQSKDRRFLKEEILACQNGYTVKFTGEQFNQEDLTVWETIVHLARQHPLGAVCSFTAHGILKALGLPTGGCNHKTLHSSIIRLTGGVVEINADGKRYFGTLIESGVKHEITSHYIIKLNPDILRLYGENQWTSIDWKQRMALRRKPLAQALHAYFSSHKKPFPVTLSFLQKITGSRNAQMASFKRHCRVALDSLQAIGFLESYSIEGDRLTVVRSPISLPPQE